MWFLIVPVLLLLSPGTKSQISNTRVVDAEAYFTRVAQEVVRELEAADWCSFRVPTVYQNYTFENSVTFYDWTLEGEVEYENGFLMSLSEVDILQASVIQQLTTEAASVRGDLRLRHVVTGYDVRAHLSDGDHFYTGVFTHDVVTYRLMISRAFGSGALTTSASSVSQQGVSGGRIELLPSTNLTEILSRFWFAYSPDLSSWATNNLAPTLDVVARTRVEFPRICYNCAT